MAQLSDATSRQGDLMIGQGEMDDEDEDEANDDISAIGEVKDIRLSLFKTENGTQLFAKPGAAGGSRVYQYPSHQN